MTSPTDRPDDDELRLLLGAFAELAGTLGAVGSCLGIGAAAIPGNPQTDWRYWAAAYFEAPHATPPDEGVA